MRKFIVILSLFICGTAFAYRIAKPVPITDMNPNSLVELNQTLEELWDITNGRMSEVLKLNIGDTTNYMEVKNDGEVNLHGTARVWFCEDLIPAVLSRSAGGVPPDEDFIDLFPFHRYHRLTEESVYYVWHVPCDYAVSSGSVRGYYEFVVENPPTSGGTNQSENVRMGFEYKKISDSEVFDFDAGTSSGYLDETIAVDETAGIIHTTILGTCTTTGWKTGDTILFRFYRDSTAAEDTYDNEGTPDNNDVWIKTYHLEYLKDRLGEAL